MTNLFSYKKFWAKRFGTAPFLPMSRDEMEHLGWDSCDIILVTGDAYVDHPSFGMAIIGRLLEAQGFRVGIISQPDWQSAEAFKKLGKPNLFFGVTSGNMDSMVNRYTADRKFRSDDSYTPHAEANKRPDRATIVYSQRCRQAYRDVPIVIGGIEASLRRLAHYDYWSDKVRRSILLDSKADILIYGNAERAIVALAHRLAKKESIDTITDLRGTVVMKKTSSTNTNNNLIRLPNFDLIKKDPIAYVKATREIYLQSNPNNAKTLVQKHGDRDVWVNPPAIPLNTKELDQLYELPFARVPHPIYGNAKIPAYDMIRFSVTIMRGCFGGCSFCSITAHEGRIIQSRSESSILKEIEDIRDKTPSFTGIISDLGGPTANMYGLNCQKPNCQKVCHKFSCLYPNICPNLNTNHHPLIQLYQKAKKLPGIKKILIASGVRYDLAMKSPEYIKELVHYHVGGYLKIAPEHICPGPLSKMMKPSIKIYEDFKKLFDRFSDQAHKEQYLIPYFIASHPGTTDEDMLKLALWLKKNKFRLDKVQNFLPTPMTLATCMYHSEKNPLITSLDSRLRGNDNKEDQNNNKGNENDNREHGNNTKGYTNNYQTVFIPKKGKTRQLHKALLRYHDPKNWPIIRQALKRMGREDLIGKGKYCLVPQTTRRYKK